MDEAAGEARRKREEAITTNGSGCAYIDSIELNNGIARVADGICHAESPQDILECAAELKNAPQASVGYLVFETDGSDEWLTSDVRRSAIYNLGFYAGCAPVLLVRCSRADSPDPSRLSLLDFYRVAVASADDPVLWPILDAHIGSRHQPGLPARVLHDSTGTIDGVEGIKPVYPTGTIRPVRATRDEIDEDTADRLATLGNRLPSDLHLGVWKILEAPEGSWAMEVDRSDALVPRGSFEQIAFTRFAPQEIYARYAFASITGKSVHWLRSSSDAAPILDAISGGVLPPIPDAASMVPGWLYENASPYFALSNKKFRSRAHSSLELVSNAHCLCLSPDDGIEAYRKAMYDYGTALFAVMRIWEHGAKLAGTDLPFSRDFDSLIASSPERLRKRILNDRSRLGVSDMLEVYASGVPVGDIVS